MPKLTRSAALLAGCALALPIAGCAHGGKHGGDTAYVARDVNTLYAAAQRMMDNRDYDTAAKLFDEVERQHPYSVWARRAQIMSAFNYYLAEKYTESISSAQRFLTIHPGNSEAPYAHYLIAMSYYQQIEDVNRDQATTQQALDAFNELIRLYPDTRYASDARLKLDLIQDHLAGKEMDVGRFYERSGEWLAASLRFRKVVDQYQTTSHAPEALERLVECYLALGVPQEAEKAAAVLGKNYPGTYWYKQAYTLIARKTPRAARQALVPAPTPAAVPAPAPAPMPAPPQG
jgi:outer membrane protein assembly factor BamD